MERASLHEAAPFFLIVPAQCEDLLPALEGMQVYRLKDMSGHPEDSPRVWEGANEGTGQGGEGLEGVLKAMGISRKARGYAYLQAAVEAVAQDPSLTIALTKRLYPDIAARYGVTAFGVERGIRYAVETAWSRSDAGTLERLLGEPIKGKPTNGEFIAGLVHLLEEEGRDCPQSAWQRGERGTGKNG